MSKQYDILKQIVESLIETIKNEEYTNESTLKHNFFYYLKLKNKNYKVSVEEDLKEHINFNGRADYYLDAKSKSYRNDVVIEFKINCNNTDLILHDIKKLEKIKKLDKYIAPIFINVFSDEINFRNYLITTQKLFENTNVYCITVSPKINGFYLKEGLQIIERKLKEITFIVNNARFIETRLIPTDYNVIRIPNKGGMARHVNLYPSGRTYHGIDYHYKIYENPDLGKYIKKKSRGWSETKYLKYTDPLE